MTVIMQMPCEPRCEYQAGSSGRRHTFAASSSTTSIGTGNRPPRLPLARRCAASTIDPIRAVVNAAEESGPSFERA